MPGLCSRDVADILFPHRQFIRSSLYDAIYNQSSVYSMELEKVTEPKCRCGWCQTCKWRQAKARFRTKQREVFQRSNAETLKPRDSDERSANI